MKPSKQRNIQCRIEYPIHTYGIDTAYVSKPNESRGLEDDSALTLVPVRWIFGVADPEVQYEFRTAQKYLTVSLKVGCRDEFVWKIPDIAEKVRQIQMGTRKYCFVLES